MLIYILNIFSLLLWRYFYYKSIDKQKAKKIIIIMVVLQFAILQGFRADGVGADTSKYISYYNYIKNAGVRFIDLFIDPPFNFEIGYMLLMYFIGLMGFSARWFLIIIALIINTLLGVFIYKNSKDFLFSFWIFIGIEFFSLSFTMLRQMIAILLVANSYQYIKEKKIKQYFFIILLAVAFHKTALVFLPMYLLNYVYPWMMKLKKKTDRYLNYKIVAVFSSYLIVVGVFPKVIEFVLNLFYGYYHFTSSGLGTLFFVMVAILCLLLLYEKVYDDKSQELFMYQVFLFVASLFQLSTVIITQIYRGAFYYYIFAIIILPYIKHRIDNKRLKQIYTIVVHIATLFQYIAFSMNVYNLVPYMLF